MRFASLLVGIVSLSFYLSESQIFFSLARSLDIPQSYLSDQPLAKLLDATSLSVDADEIVAFFAAAIVVVAKGSPVGFEHDIDPRC